MATELQPPVNIPQNGAYFGAFVNPSAYSPDPTPTSSADYVALETETEGLETAIGRHLATDIHYLHWGDITTARLDGADFQGDSNRGRIPIISWQCGDNLTTITNDLNTGTDASPAPFDDNTIVTTAAAAIKAYKTPVFIRFFYEFNTDLNGEGNPGGTAKDCFSSGTMTEKATEFIAAWEAIVNAFRAAGATNVAWVWNPAYDPSDQGDASLDQLAYFLPPASYVDWIGLDAYDKSGIGFDATVSPFYQKFGSTGYAMMVAETGEQQSPLPSPSPSPDTCTQAQYFADATYSISNGAQGSLSTCASSHAGSTGLTSFPNIKAFSYFDAAGPYGGWTLASPSPAFAAFSTMANNAYFEPNPTSAPSPTPTLGVSQIAIGANGAMWALANDNHSGAHSVWQYDATTGHFTQVPGTTYATNIAIDADGTPWIVSSSGIYNWNGTQFKQQTCSPTSCPATAIAWGAGQMWILAAAPSGPYPVQQCTATQGPQGMLSSCATPIPGAALNTISVDFNGNAWGTGANGTIYQWNPSATPAPAFTTVPSALGTGIAVTPDLSTIWILGYSNACNLVGCRVYVSSNQGGAFTAPVPAIYATSIAVGPNGIPWIANANGLLFEGTATSPNPSPSPSGGLFTAQPFP